jgi:hypothetical protein
MISPELCSELADYWRKENVVCERVSFSGALFRTELAEIWDLVGMPRQEWWLFQFIPPSDSKGVSKVDFGNLGHGLTLAYDVPKNSCLLKYSTGLETFGNSSFAAFAQFLLLFDKAIKRIQRECEGDSGEAFERELKILRETEATMRSLDSTAFQGESNLWPFVLMDVNG